jgi:GNAT superfamily N-acetyltransferase
MITVRRAKPGDFADIQRLNEALFHFEKPFLGGTRNSQWPYTDFAVKYFNDAVHGRKDLHAFVAVNQSRVVGYLIAICKPSLWMLTNPVAEIENMFVEEPHRHQGAGSKLIEAFKAWAKSKGARRLRVGVATENLAAFDFYRHHGFKELESVLEQPMED